MTTEASNNDSSQSGPLRAALVADGEAVQYLSRALSGGGLSIVAQSGMSQVEGIAGVTWYDDTRAMIAQSGAEALVVAVSPHAADDINRMTEHHGLPVWRLPPLARSFAEAAELVERVRKRGVLYRVASWWEAVAEDVRWATHTQEGFRPQFVRLHCSAAGPAVSSWRSNDSETPGGVLALDAYPLLETLVALGRVPELVSARTSKVRRRSRETQRETEDVAIATFVGEQDAVAAAVATWDIPPYGMQMELHGAATSVRIDDEQVTAYGPDGKTIDVRPHIGSGFLRYELEHFVATVRGGGGAAAEEATLSRHMAVMALLQATYLSARTGQPESPRKLYEVQGWPLPQ